MDAATFTLLGVLLFVLMGSLKFIKNKGGSDDKSDDKGEGRKDAETPSAEESFSLNIYMKDQDRAKNSEGGKYTLTMEKVLKSGDAIRKYVEIEYPQNGVKVEGPNGGDVEEIQPPFWLCFPTCIMDFCGIYMGWNAGASGRTEAHTKLRKGKLGGWPAGGYVNVQEINKKLNEVGLKVYGFDEKTWEEWLKVSKEVSNNGAKNPGAAFQSCPWWFGDIEEDGKPGSEIFGRGSLLRKAVGINTYYNKDKSARYKPSNNDVTCLAPASVGNSCSWAGAKGSGNNCKRCCLKIILNDERSGGATAKGRRRTRRTNRRRRVKKKLN